MTRWTRCHLYPLVIAGLLLAGALLVWVGTRQAPVEPAQYGTTSPAPAPDTP